MLKIEKVIKKEITAKGKTLILTFVKCDNNKWYEAIKTRFGDYFLKEIKQNEIF